LVGSLSHGWRLQNRHQRAVAIAALLGLTTEGFSLYWVFGAFPSKSAVNAFLFANELLAGIVVAMLISLFIPKIAKIVLGISGILFIGLNLLLIVLIDTKRFIPVRAFCSLNGLLIGLSIPLTLFLWLTYRKSREEQSGEGEVAASETVAGSANESNQL
jgi:prepilin signal peptidase PulO-like enzyme (type II secretory pathway)